MSGGRISGQSIPFREPFGGSGNSATSVFFNAPFMKPVQMAAGKLPPVTVSRPPVPESDTGIPFLFSFVKKTAVANCGVKPTNQALLFMSVVPVFPAAGRPRSRAAAPVPRETTSVSAYVTVSATPFEKTLFVDGSCLYRTSPLLSMILRTNVVLARSPRAAKVAYAFAMSTADGDAVPRTKVRSRFFKFIPGVRLGIPARTAASATRSTPTASSMATYAVFTDSRVASRSVISPYDSSL